MIRNRIFNGSDANLIENARTLHALFTANMADFTALDPQLNATFAQEWKEAIDEASSTTDNRVLLSQQAQHTHQVNTLMEEARKKYMEVMYFAEKAFGDDSKILHEFGMGDYKAARKSQPLMIAFMDQLTVTVSKYHTELEQVGCTQALLQSIGDMKRSLEEANTSQELFIKARPVLTARRCELMNRCYDYINRIRMAAKTIYFDNPVKANMFTFDANVRRKRKAQQTEVTESATTVTQQVMTTVGQ